MTEEKMRRTYSKTCLESEAFKTGPGQAVVDWELDAGVA